MIRDVEVNSEYCVDWGMPMDMGALEFAVTRAKTGVFSDYQ
jgi:hypothetical protein